MLRPDREAFSAYAYRLGLIEVPQRCFLYLMRCERYTKVGIAADVEKRRAKLQMANPFPVTVARKYGFGDRRYAHLAEQATHKDLAEHRVYGEWFEADFDTVESLVLEIVDAARELSRKRRATMKAKHTELWNRYLADQAFRAEVHSA